MKIEPDFSSFESAYQDGRPQVIWTRLIADLETPVSAMMKLADGRANSFLYESIQGGETRGRYSIIGLKPDVLWRCQDGKAEINRQARSNVDAFEDCGAAPLEALRQFVESARIDLPHALPPMAAGVFGYIGYDMVRLMEDLPNQPDDALGVPDAILMRPTISAIFDTVTDEVIVVTPVWPEAGIDARSAYARAGERISDVVADFDRSRPREEFDRRDLTAMPDPVSNTDHDDYLAMVEKAKDYIKAGDVFQVVPSQRFSQPFKLPPFALYRALRRLNPSPFLYFLNFGDFSIVGSSPEILVRLRDDTVTIRPIAGTRAGEGYARRPERACRTSDVA